MQAVIGREPLDGGNCAAGGAEGGHQARMKRGAIEPDRACAAVAGVTSLLDAEDTAVAQECSQALSRLRLGGDELAVNIEVHGRVLIPKFVKPAAPRMRTRGYHCRNFKSATLSAWLREFRADLLGKIVGRVTPVGRKPVDVVEIVVGRNLGVDGAPQIVSRRHLPEAQLHRARRRRRDRE